MSNGGGALIAMRLALAAALAGLGTFALVALSAVGYFAEPSETALVRLSWRAVGERIERCRVLSEEELAALPLHMRQKEICEGTLAPFALEVSIDGEPVFSEEIRAAGVREDRPTYVFQEFRVAPGPHDLSVRFGRADAGAASDSPGTASVLEAGIDLAPRQVLLVTREQDGEELVLRSSL